MMRTDSEVFWYLMTRTEMVHNGGSPDALDTGGSRLASLVAMRTGNFFVGGKAAEA